MGIVRDRLIAWLAEDRIYVERRLKTERDKPVRESRGDIACAHCGTIFQQPFYNSLYCDPACKRKARAERESASEKLREQKRLDMRKRRARRK